MSSSFWNEHDLERVIQNFNPCMFFELPSYMFDKKGDLRYCNTEPLKLTRGKWDYYTPYKGWIRYGLNVDKFGSSGANWLGCDGVDGEWAVGFHGFRRDVISTLKHIATEGFKVFQGQNSEWGTTSMDVGPNASLFNQKNCGKGVFLTPQMKHMTVNIENCRLLKPIRSCAEKQYYIVNVPGHIRPYGLVIHFLTEADAKSIMDSNNFNLAPAVPFVQ